MEFEAAIGNWRDGYMAVSITLERTRVSYTDFRKRAGCLPQYAQRGKWAVARDLVSGAERERVREFFDWIIEPMKVAREYYPSEPRFARDSKIPGSNWAFILWTDDETYCTRGRSGSPAWWDDACAQISAIVDTEFPSKHR